MYRATVGIEIKVRVIVEIASQKNGRSCKSREHHSTVRSDLTARDERTTGHQEHRATAVEGCVDHRKDGVVRHSLICLYGERCVLGKWYKPSPRGLLRASSRELRAIFSLEVRSCSSRQLSRAHMPSI